MASPFPLHPFLLSLQAEDKPLPTLHHTWMSLALFGGFWGKSNPIPLQYTRSQALAWECRLRRSGGVG